MIILKFRLLSKIYINFNVIISCYNYLKLCNINKDYFNNMSYILVTIIENLKHLRKKLFTLNIKPYRKEIVIFGITIVKKDYKQSKFKTINK